jgi:two-component system NtrC family sensor kinase
MKKLAAGLLMITLFVTAHAQRKTIDSLKKLIATAKEDTIRIKLMCRLGRMYVGTKPDSSALIGRQALELSKGIHSQLQEFRSLDLLAQTFAATGNYPKALTYYLAAYKLTETLGKPLIVPYILSNMATVYSYEGDNRQSIKYTLKALALAKLVRRDDFVADNLCNLGDMYEKLNILDSALLYSRQGHDASVKLKDAEVTGAVLNNLGNIYTKLHKTDSALYYYRQAIPFLIQADDEDIKCETTLGMAKIFRQLGMQDSSLYYARQSMAVGRRGGFIPRVLDASKFLTTFFKQQGKLDSAFHYQEVAITAKDSLYSQEKTKEVQNLIFSERQRQFDIQERDAVYKANIRFYLLVAVIAFLIVLAFVFWRNNRKNEKARHLLQVQKEQIQTTLSDLRSAQTQLIQSEKMASLGELTAGIAHEIQNPLNFVNNFSEVSAELVDEMEEELGKGDIEEARAIGADLKQNLEKIRHHGKRADFIVKGMLQHSRTSTGERQPTNINTLADEFLKLSYHGLRAKDKNFNAELVANFDKNLPKVSIAQQDIGRVLLNLFNNAFYAVNQKAKTATEDYKPEVVVTTSTENNNVIIKVRDNGNGIPNAIKDKIMQPFFTTKPTGEGTGLGLSLSYDIVVKGHGGSITVNSEQGEGSEFMISIPINN